MAAAHAVSAGAAAHTETPVTTPGAGSVTGIRASTEPSGAPEAGYTTEPGNTTQPGTTTEPRNTTEHSNTVEPGGVGPEAPRPAPNRHGAGATGVISRRTAIRGLAALGVAGLGAGGYLAVRHGAIPLPAGISQHVVDQGPAGVIPDVPTGTEKVEQLYSSSRGRTVDFYTAVPEGHGDGQGLPVCLILHGASATAADYPAFGFGRFLTDAVRRGAPAFVLAGATGTRGWEPDGPDDAQQMVRQEMPGWCADRGFDITRMVAWGWSLGGYGALLMAEDVPGFVRAVAAFSPAVQRGDAVFGGVDALRGTAIGLWCGKSDGFYPEVQALQAALPEPAVIAAYDLGAHTRKYWNRVTPAAFDFIAAELI
jgi:hypothetical protein